MVDMVAAAVFVVGDIADIMEPVFDLPMPAREVEDFGRAGPGHWPILRNLLRATDTSGNLTSDTHIAALAAECGATICSADHDFKRFLGVDHVDPLDESMRPGR